MTKVTVSVSYKWRLMMLSSDDIWDSEQEARDNAIMYAKKYNIPESRISIYKTTIEVF